MIKNHLIKKVIFIPCILVIAVLQAQALSGKVTDSETGEPLPGAQVFVKGTFVGTTADINGAYFLDVEGDVTVVVAYIGFKTQEVATSGGAVDFAYCLNPLRQFFSRRFTSSRLMAPSSINCVIRKLLSVCGIRIAEYQRSFVE